MKNIYLWSAILDVLCSDEGEKQTDNPGNKNFDKWEFCVRPYAYASVVNAEN